MHSVFEGVFECVFAREFAREFACVFERVFGRNTATIQEPKCCEGLKDSETAI